MLGNETLIVSAGSVSAAARVRIAAIPGALYEVLGKPRFALLAALIAGALFLFSVYLPNLSLLRDILLFSDYSFSAKTRVLVALAGSLNTNFTTFSAVSTVAIDLLIGINAAMVAYLVTQRRTALKRGGAVTGFAGVTAGILGVGCAACGSVILTSVFASIGASGTLALLPLRGGEFGLLGIALLLVSLSLLAHRIRSPLVC